MALATCHVLSSHMWLVAAVLVLVENYHSRRFYQKAPGLAVRSGALPFPARTEGALFALRPERGRARGPAHTQRAAGGRGHFPRRCTVATSQLQSQQCDRVLPNVTSGGNWAKCYFLLLPVNLQCPLQNSVISMACFLAPPTLPAQARAPLPHPSLIPPWPWP